MQNGCKFADIVSEDRTFIGGRDDVWHEGFWFWDDGEPGPGQHFHFTAWAYGEPNGG